MIQLTGWLCPRGEFRWPSLISWRAKEPRSLARIVSDSHPAFYRWRRFPDEIKSGRNCHTDANVHVALKGRREAEEFLDVFNIQSYPVRCRGGLQTKL